FFKLEPNIPPRPMVVRVVHTIATLVHQELLELLNLCPRIYDDGDLSVLEIGSQAGSKIAFAREPAELRHAP
ncbi:MAG: hypothetical protein JO161_09800, partial [Planctomycetaceae bacterium]|nr:hypothetical protein [Planctomycetaceae bacterium]